MKITTADHPRLHQVLSEQREKSSLPSLPAYDLPDAFTEITRRAELGLSTLSDEEMLGFACADDDTRKGVMRAHLLYRVELEIAAALLMYDAGG